MKPARRIPPTRGAAAERRALRRILVATDGTAASRGALTVARLLARRDGAVIDVVCVLPPWSPPPNAREFRRAIGDPMAARLTRVLRQCHRTLGNVAWTVRPLEGGVAAGIGDMASAGGHDLVVVGLPRRGVDAWVDRLLRPPTALGVARRTDVPVLAVPATAAALPTRAVAGMEDVPAARVARRAALEVAIVHSDRHGTATARELLAHARAANADLIVLGCRPPASLRRRLWGGVSRRVVGSAECSVLLARPAHPRGAERPIGTAATGHATLALQPAEVA